MPTAPDNHDAYDYAARIRERLPRRLQKNQILIILLPTVS